jgi:hypothetical protein
MLLGLIGFGIILLSSALMLGVAALQRKSPPSFREIPAFTHLRQAVNRIIENGTRLHVSLGRGVLTSPQSASALAGLSLVRRLAELASAGDRPPIATSGDAVLTILSQDALQAGSMASAQRAYDPTDGRLTGLTSFSYAAGAVTTIRDENISTNVLIGNFGVEVAWLADAAEWASTFTTAASDNLTAQAVLYACAQEPLIGEELYASGAYVDAGPLHAASLRVQDILRWLIIIVILVGALLKLAGIL